MSEPPAADAGVRLTPVRPAHRFDEAALERYLNAHVAGFAGPLAVRQFAGGQSNPTFVLESGGRTWVLRKKPPGTLLPSAHAVEREYRVMQALRDSGVPVPSMLHLCTERSVVGTEFFVMQHVAGRVLRDPLLPGMTPAERSRLYDDFVDVLARLHRVDPAAVGLADFGRPGSYYTRQVGRWAKQYKASETERIPAMERLIDWLPANVPADDATGVVHGDFRIENCVVHPEEPRILAVLDWELSTLGHPLGDVAYCCMPYRGQLGSSMGSLQGCSLAANGIPSEAEFLARYCRATGRGRIAHWDFYIVFALFRVAAIAQGVYRRGLDGNASSDDATTFRDACRSRAELAWGIVETGGGGTGP